MKKIKFALFKNLILSSVLLVTIILLTFSWFTQNSEASADGIYIQCTTPPGVEIAVVEPGKEPTNDDYSTDGITLSKEDTDFLKDLSMLDLTSDGKTFYRPVIEQSGNKAVPNTDKNWGSPAEKNKAYLSFDLYIRSEATQNIALAETSKFSADTTPANNKSTYGSFSRNAAVGASRFSVVSDNNVKLLWIPRPDVHLIDDKGSMSVKIGEPTTDSSKHLYYEVINGTPDKNIKTFEDPVVSKNINKEYVLGEDKEITQLTSTKDFDGKTYYVNHVTCNMWIDGEDDEARLALVKGKFTINLDISIVN